MKPLHALLLCAGIAIAGQAHASSQVPYENHLSNRIQASLETEVVEVLRTEKLWEAGVRQLKYHPDINDIGLSYSVFKQIYVEYLGIASSLERYHDEMKCCTKLKDGLEKWIWHAKGLADEAHKIEDFCIDAYLLFTYSFETEGNIPHNDIAAIRSMLNQQVQQFAYEVDGLRRYHADLTEIIEKK